jgi:hypothetical protein
MLGSVHCLRYNQYTQLFECELYSSLQMVGRHTDRHVFYLLSLYSEVAGDGWD